MVRVSWVEISLALGFVVACFKVWREMRLDYEEDKILGLMLGMAMAAWLGGRLAWWKATSEMGLLGAVVLAILFLIWWCKRYKWNFWQWLDQLGEVSLAVGAVASVSVVLAVGWLACNLLKRYYRRFGWYESGKPGLVGVVAVWWWGMAQLVIAKGGMVWVYFGAWLTVAGAVTIYLRSGRKISQALKRIWPKNV